MSMGNEGAHTHAQRQMPSSSYIPNISSNVGGGTYTSSHNEPSVSDYENVFGPSARDIKDDLQKYKRHGRWHLPDILKGPNPWLADRVDGLITDAASSPFTSTILPYKYFDNVDGQITWNVWSFDEAMASRVPYEAAARTLTQSKRSFSGYAVRHGLAITLEHNFMMTPQGRDNFQKQLNQLVGSIQYSNDMDVHMALILAPSHEKYMMDKYNNYNKSAQQSCREYVDLFGFMQKNQNALDILIEEAKLKLKLWGGPMPNFLLTNSKLTFQLTMNPERTNYISQGPDGIKRLRQGPDLSSYRGISIIPSRSFSMETGQPPRDMLRRRVRVAEYYRIAPDENNHKRVFELYNEERDTFFSITWKDLFKYADFELDGSEDVKIIKLQQLIKKNIKKNNKNGSLPNSKTNDGGDSSDSDGGDDSHTSDSSTPQKTLKRGFRAFKAARAADQRKDIADKKGIPLKKKRNSIGQPMHEWNQLIETINERPSDETIVIPHDKIIASFADDKTVFAPFVSSLHYSKKEEYMQSLQNYKNTPLQQCVQDSLVEYPRTAQSTSAPFTLTHPFTHTQVNQGTNEYKEAKVCLARLFSRYAAPTSYLQVQDNQLTFNTDCAQTKNLAVDNMYLQPLGAVNEPNHPLHHENLAMGKTKDVHSSWVLTEELLDYLYNQPERWALASSIAASTDGTNLSKAAFSLAVFEQFEVAALRQGWKGAHKLTQKMNAYTWGATDNYLATSDYLHPQSDLNKQFHVTLKQHAPDAIVTNKYLAELEKMGGNHPWLQKASAAGNANPQTVHTALCNRMSKDAYTPYIADLTDSVGSDRLMHELLHMPAQDANCNIHTGSFVGALGSYLPVLGASAAPVPDTQPANGYSTFDTSGTPIPDSALPKDSEVQTQRLRILDLLDQQVKRKVTDVTGQITPVEPEYNPLNWEFIIIRPNIEHYMLGIIMGLSGDALGNTLWGQTELSVYDDSQHGVWGMSYKYHERAIVFNEKNLIRLWDIAYDGYNGGKNDSYVNWTDRDDVERFKEDTNDVTRDYRGKSMMVMAFYNTHSKPAFRTNWPSPIVFYQPPNAHGQTTTVTGADNNANIAIKEFQVFDQETYPEYKKYIQMMPNFHELHQMRKSASESAKEDETQIDSLAYQGTMRIKNNGMVLDTINGSGHHAVDYIGVSSVRAGKGYKMSGGISQLIRQI